MHGQGAVAQLTRSGDRVTTTRLIEGAEAEALVRAHAFGVSDAHRTNSRAHLLSGKQLVPALKEAFGKDRGRLVQIHRTQTSRLYQPVQGGLLEIVLTPDDAIKSHIWHTGGAALDLLAVLQREKDWDAPAFSKTPLAARTHAESMLYVAIRRGTPLDTQVEDERRVVRVRARTPEGVRIFVFHVSEPERVERWDMGTGTSEILDPGDLVSFARRVERELPDRSKVRTPERLTVRANELYMAATALREALRFIRAGSDLPPLGIYKTRAAEVMRTRNPERFSRASLQTEASRLEALAKTWVP